MIPFFQFEHDYFVCWWISNAFIVRMFKQNFEIGIDKARCGCPNFFLLAFLRFLQLLSNFLPRLIQSPLHRSPSFHFFPTLLLRRFSLSFFTSLRLYFSIKCFNSHCYRPQWRLRVFVLDLYGALQHFITHVKRKVKKRRTHTLTIQHSKNYYIAQRHKRSVSFLVQIFCASAATAVRYGGD